MVPSPRLPFTWDYWQTSPPDVVELTCLIPNSICIPLEAKGDATLHEVKEDLWDKADSYPLRGMLHDMSAYVFQFINSLAVLEDVEDESKRLRDVKPVCGVLKLIKRPGEKAGDKLLNTQISHLIGKGLNDFEALNNPEVNDFRSQMRQLAERRMREKMRWTWLEQLQYRHPPRLAATTELPQMISMRLRNKNFVLVAKFEKLEATHTFSVPYTITPQQLLKIILTKKANTLNTRGEQPSDFVLKVCGREEYLVGEVPLGQFLYIQETLARDAVPTVVTVSIDNIQIDRPTAVFAETRNPYPTSTIRKKGKHISTYDISEEFTITVNAINNINIDTSGSVEVGIQAGLFHDGKSLCEFQKTVETSVSAAGQANWDERLTFPIQVLNLPRMTRLCFVIYEISKTSRSLKSRKVKDSTKDLYINPVGWVNTMVFDYRGVLKRSAETLYTWSHVDELPADHLLNPLGTVLTNPYTDQAAHLTIHFSSYKCSEQTVIVYPSIEEVTRFAEINGSLESSLNRLTLKEVTSDDLEQLRLMAERDPIYEMHEQERKEIWRLREHFRTTSPGLLGKLLQCVEWGEREESAAAVALVSGWPELPVQRALELLDYAYSDPAVRSYAVKCLRSLSDEELSLYLLQLVQALKHESYLGCELVYFLLERALSNMNIGHYFFWHLKSEMHVPSMSVRFGLILEAYCRGCQEHLAGLLRQITFFQKLRGTSELVRQRKDIEKARAFLIEYLKEPHCQETLSLVTSPLDPSFTCKQIKPEKCRVMDSKMRPLALVFENVDMFGQEICIILKNGDDLRQDMFTLQMLRIMDKLWKANGYDFRMNLYNCISMDQRVGMIEVVVNAETIAKIQKERVMIPATSAFKKGSLLSWLREHNSTEDALNKAIEEFTWSCAGYCVATYVLGIADRHSDNIMIKRTGQLFHVDFGHILGHFKEKFGVRRERVPFVLTHDFVHVIIKGQNTKNKEALEFQLFQRYCEEAFMILRRNGELFLSLCSMMISTGLPELSSEKDLQYLRDTLVMDLPEEKAREHFKSKFNEALRNSWKTSINWALHNNAKNNKQ